MAEFIFLGANCSSQDLDNGNTSLLVKGTDGSCVLVDVSCNLALPVDACADVIVLTHEHIDHVYALPSFLHQSWLAGRTKPLDIYVPSGLEAIPEGMISLFALREKNGMFPIRILSVDRPFTVGSLAITPFRTDHTKTSLGLVFEEDGKKLVYTCDTRPFSSVPDVMRGADVLIHESSGLEAKEELLVRKGHSSGADAGRLAKELNAAALYLCHLPRGRDAKAEILREAEKVFSPCFLPEVLKVYTL